MDTYNRQPEIRLLSLVAATLVRGAGELIARALATTNGADQITRSHSAARPAPRQRCSRSCLSWPVLVVGVVPAGRLLPSCTHVSRISRAKQARQLSWPRVSRAAICLRLYVPVARVRLTIYRVRALPKILVLLAIAPPTRSLSRLYSSAPLLKT